VTTGCLFDEDLAPVVIPDRHRQGATYDAALDFERLNRQQRAVFDLMRDGEWWTLPLLCAMTGERETSVSARVRDFRKLWGTEIVVSRRKPGTDPKSGIWEYRLRVEDLR
jgi:hypothetical protein